MGVFAKVGINRIGFAKKGSLLTTPTNIVLIGGKYPSELVITDHETEEDYRGRPTRNKLNAKITAKSNQPNLLKLKNIIDVYCDEGGADAELLAVPQSTGVDGGCFQFLGASEKHIGIDFEYLMSNEERSLSVMAEVALEYPEMKSLIDAADNNTQAVWGVTNNGVDLLLKRYPYFSELKIATVDIFAKDEYISYRMQLSTDSDKTIWNRNDVKYIKIEIEATGRKATIQSIVDRLNFSPYAEVVVKQMTGATTYEKFVFQAGVLTPKTEFKISDTERYSKITLMGKVPIKNFSYSFVALDGGGTSADGTEGGTVNVSV